MRPGTIEQNAVSVTGTPLPEQEHLGRLASLKILHPLLSAPEEVKFNGTNTFQRHQFIMLMLMARGFSKHLAQDPVESEDPRFEAKEAKETFICGWLIGNITPEMYDKFLDMDTVKQLQEQVSEK